MRDEISAAVLFLARLIEKSENFNPDQLELFKNSLSELLLQKFENHWFPEKPDKGQGYRCIRVNGVNRRDATLEKAAIACGIKYEDMKLPCELTIWVDPNEVCCRFGENKGSFCTLASFSDRESSGSSSGSEDSLLDETSSVKESSSPLSSPLKQPTQVLTENKDRRSGGGGGGSGRTTNGRSSSGSHGRHNRHGNGSNSSNNGSGLYPHSHHHHHLLPGGGGGGSHHPLHAWYNLISPPWLSPSPPPSSYSPPYHRHNKWSPHNRYSNSSKQATLKA